MIARRSILAMLCVLSFGLGAVTLVGCKDDPRFLVSDAADSTAGDTTGGLDTSGGEDGSGSDLSPNDDLSNPLDQLAGDLEELDANDTARDDAFVDPCQPNPCTGAHQTRCEVAVDGPVCRCDSGYHLDPLSQECVLDDPPNPCDPNPCTEPKMSVCEPAGVGYTCKCDEGFEISQEFQSCVPIDRCNPNPCTAPNRSQCKVVNDSAVCECDPDYTLKGEECVAKDPCDPNPCTVGLRTTCLALTPDTYECRCSVGYVEDGDGCILVPSCDQRYSTVLGKEGNALRQALFSLTGKTVSIMDYEAARAQIFWTLDWVSGQVRGVYSGKWVAVKKGVLPNYSSEMNAEHTWPQSLGAEGDAKADLHHLFPTIPTVNSSRGNTPFGSVIVADKCYDLTGIVLCPFVSDNYYSIRGKDAAGLIVWEPANPHKGDVARAMFYFSVRYELPIDARQEANFRRWHEEDPVSPKELQRNDDIETLQHNRNPFIDCPHLVPLISDF